MRSRIGHLVALFCFLTGSAAAQWSTLTLDVPSGYNRCWHTLNLTTVDNVISIGAPAQNVCYQSFGNGHLQTDDSNNTLVLGYGGMWNTDNLVGDGITLIKRTASGTIDSNPSGNPYGAVLYFPKATTSDCDPAYQKRDCPTCPWYCEWTWKGGLGAGGAIAKTTVATASGYKFFAVVAVGVFNRTQDGHPYNSTDRSEHGGCTVQGTTSPAQGWLTWAVSKNGTDWVFVNRSGGTTADPAQSLYLISRANKEFTVQYQSTDPSTCTDTNHWAWLDHFWHSAMFYNAGDGYFYIILGWDVPGANRGTWWRMQYNAATPFGIGTIQRLVNASVAPYVPCFQGTSGCTNDGLGATIPTGNAWATTATYPNPNQPAVANDGILGNAGLADPMDITLLTKSNGSVDSIVLTYKPTQGFGAVGPTNVYYIKSTSTSFPFFDATVFPPKKIDVSGLSSVSGTLCYGSGSKTIGYRTSGGSGGNYMALWQNGYQGNGNPDVYGVFATGRTDLNLCTPNTGFQTFHLLAQ